MRKLPMRPTFPDSLLAETSMLTLEERGAYRELLDHLWLRGGWLDDDDKKIARLLRIGLARWKKIKRNLIPLFCYSDNKFTQTELLNQYSHAVHRTEINKENGYKGVLKRKANASANGQANPGQALVQSLSNRFTTHN